MQNEEDFTTLDENYKALQELGNEIISSTPEEEKTKISSLLDELGASLQALKGRMSGGSFDSNVHVGVTRDGEGLDDGTPTGNTRGNEAAGGDICSAVDNRGIQVTSLNLSDDSDEEHRILKSGSSDGSQYGSDSGMGDSLMNTLASECIDGVSKTPTGSPVNNIAQKDVDEVSEGGDTICDERSPINEHDIDGIILASNPIAQTKQNKDSEQNKSQVEGRSRLNKNHEEVLRPTNVTPNDLKRKNVKLEDDRPLENDVQRNHLNNKSSRGTEINAIHDEDVSKDISETDAVTECDQQSKRALETLDIPHDSMEIIDEATADTGPFIPAEFFLPEDASTNTTLSTEQNSSRNLPWKQTTESFENVPYEIPPPEQTTSGNYPRVHDIDEELQLRNLSTKNINPDEGEQQGEDFIDSSECSLVSCLPPPMKTVEEFVEEPDALFQRLVDMEVLLKPEGTDEDNLKSALLKHVVSNVNNFSLLSDFNSVIVLLLNNLDELHCFLGALC